MFKKLKQRIEEGDQPPQTTSNVLASTPKKNTKPPSVRSYINSNTNLKRENKWEKRRRSNASLYSSRESLLSLDSAATATVSRNSCGESFCSAETPIESQLIIGTFRDVASKDQILSELGKKNEQVKKLEIKINEMALAFMEQSRQRDRLEEALQNLRNEMHNRTEISMNESIKSLKEEYEQKLQVKDKKYKECIQKQQEESHRFSNVKELNSLQQEEVAKMKAMLIHSQTEMSRKTAELIEKTKQIENLDKQYMDQRIELEGLEERLHDLTKDRTEFDTQQKKLSAEVSTLQKEKSALKSQLSDLINELTQKSSMLDTVQLAADRAHEEVASLRQTYNLYKAKATADISDKDSELSVLRERISDLEQRLQDSRLSENDQVKALEKERSLLENRLQDAREHFTEFRTQSNDKISTLGSLVSTLDEKLKEKVESYENLQNKQLTQNKHYESKINDLQDKLTVAEKSTKSLEKNSNQLETLLNKVKDLDQKNSILKTEKMELEILADKASFLEAQNKLLDTRFKEAVDRLEKDRSVLEEKVRDLQSESRKSSFRQEHTNRRKMEQLETKVEEQTRRITQYQERLEELVEERDSLMGELTIKDEECKQASSCLEDALSRTNELKEEITNLEVSLQKKDELLTYIKETGEISMENNSVDSLLREELNSVREMFENREQVLVERDEEIEELRRVIRDRDDELATVSRQLHEFQENNKLASPGKSKYQGSKEKELQKTVMRLTNRIQELEKESKSFTGTNEQEIEVRSLKAELDEKEKKLRNLQQNMADMKKQYQKEMKNIDAGQTAKDKSPTDSNDKNSPEVKSVWKNEKEKRDFLEVNFKYLKHVILKFMCSTNDQSRQLVGVIGHLLQFTPRETSIVCDCFDWKLPLEKKR